MTMKCLNGCLDFQFLHCDWKSGTNWGCRCGVLLAEIAVGDARFRCFHFVEIVSGFSGFSLFLPFGRSASILLSDEIAFPGRDDRNRPFCARSPVDSSVDSPHFARPVELEASIQAQLGPPLIRFHHFLICWLNSVTLIPAPPEISWLDNQSIIDIGAIDSTLLHAVSCG